jgi:hypothetical protein
MALSPLVLSLFCPDGPNSVQGLANSVYDSSASDTLYGATRPIVAPTIFKVLGIRRQNK